MGQIKSFIMKLRAYSPRVVSMSEQGTLVTNVERIAVDTNFTEKTLYIGYESQMQNTLRFLNGVTLFLIEDMK